MFYLLTTLATLGGVPGTLAFTATTAAALLARHLSRDRFGNLVLQAVADDVHAGTEESGSMVDASPDACG